MFTTEDEWTNAYKAADDRLSLAIDQGYITYVVPSIRAGLARDIARAVILSNVNAGTDVETGDILDGEIGVSTNG